MPEVPQSEALPGLESPERSGTLRPLQPVPVGDAELGVVLCPTTAETNCHKLGSLKQLKFIVQEIRSPQWVSLGQNQGPSRSASFWRLQGERGSLPFPLLWAAWACGLFLVLL